MTVSYLQTLVYILLISISCSGQKKDVYNPKAIELNNKAVEFIIKKQYDSALTYLDKSINIDTTYYIAYGNKSEVYCYMKDFKNALIVTTKEIEVKPDLAEGWTLLGILSDESGDTLNALNYYKKGIELYDERISNPNKKKYLEANRLNRAVSYILIGQQEKGVDEIKKLKELYPSELLLDDFLKLSKQEYLKQIFGEK